MSQVTTINAAVEPAETPLTPENWGKLGMWIFLAGDAMTFGTLLAGYGALRAGSVDWPVPANVLGVPLTGLMTFLLICSSVTMVKGLSAIKHGNQKGMILFLLSTILGGLIFLGLQAYEWTHLIVEKQVTLRHNPYGNYLFGTTFYA
ncbi:MAG: heme-copper oxidase subunit III, partial [bacterium]